MDRMVIEALKHKYEAQKASVLETFKTSDIMEDIEDALGTWYKADHLLCVIHNIEWEIADDGEETEPTLFDSVD